MDDIPELTDLVGKTSMLDGRKITIKEVFDQPLIFTGWSIRHSRFHQHSDRQICDDEIDRYVILQFLMEGKRYVCFTSSGTIIRQIEAIQSLPHAPRRFKGAIRKKNKFYKICRTETNPTRRQENE